MLYTYPLSSLRPSSSRQLDERIQVMRGLPFHLELKFIEVPAALSPLREILKIQKFFLARWCDRIKFRVASRVIQITL